MCEKRPDVFLFNPTCEYAIANGKSSWQPGRLLQKMESDLGTLPMFFAASNDFVLVDELPSGHFPEPFEFLNINIPHFVLKSSFARDPAFLQLPKNRLLPWGWSPAAHKFLEPLKPSCSEGFLSSPVSGWKPDTARLYSKKFALDLLQKMRYEFPRDLIVPENLQGKVCTTRYEIEALLHRWLNLMVKAPWSSSGRGLQPVTKFPVHEKVWEKIMGMVAKQGYVIVEPFFHKKADLAFQYEIQKGMVRYHGKSVFMTDKKGQYLGNSLNGYPDSWDGETRNFIESVAENTIGIIMNTLKSSELVNNYEGFLGVDTLIFLDEKNKLRLHPCLEINLRQTMGLLSLKLKKVILPERRGEYRTFYQPGANYSFFAEAMKKKFPLRFSGDRIEAGFLSLTEPSKGSEFGAYLLVK